MKFRDFLVDAICCLGMAVAVLSLSFWLSGWCEGAECPNCDNGLVGRGPVKYVCPLCDPLANAFGTNPAKTPDHGNAAAASPDKTHDHRQAVVRIVVAEGPSTSRGSGVAIGGNRVLTAWHVVRTNSSKNIPTVYFQDGTQSKARVIKTDDAFDLALLECETNSPAAVSLAAGCCASI